MMDQMDDDGLMAEPMVEILMEPMMDLMMEPVMDTDDGDGSDDGSEMEPMVRRYR